MSLIAHAFTLHVVKEDAEFVSIASKEDTLNANHLDLHLTPTATLADLRAEILNYIPSSPFAPRGLLGQTCMWSKIRVVKVSTESIADIAATKPIVDQLGGTQTKILVKVQIQSCDISQLAHCIIM